MPHHEQEPEYPPQTGAERSCDRGRGIAHRVRQGKLDETCSPLLQADEPFSAHPVVIGAYSRSNVAEAVVRANRETAARGIPPYAFGMIFLVQSVTLSMKNKRSNTDEQPRLFYIEPIPASQVVSRTKPRHARLDETLQTIDWGRFEKNFYDHLCLSVLEFGKQGEASGDDGLKLFQVALWTDVCALVSCVAFETRRNASRAIKDQETFDAKHGFQDDTKTRRYNRDCADFEFPEFMLFPNPELEALNSLNLDAPTNKAYVENNVAKPLLRVVAQAVEAKLFDSVPREPEIWMGVGSSKDWYDHVKAY